MAPRIDSQTLERWCNLAQKGRRKSQAFLCRNVGDLHAHNVRESQAYVDAKCILNVNACADSLERIGFGQEPRRKEKSSHASPRRQICAITTKFLRKNSHTRSTPRSLRNFCAVARGEQRRTRGARPIGGWMQVLERWMQVLEPAGNVCASSATNLNLQQILSSYYYAAYKCWSSS